MLEIHELSKTFESTRVLDHVVLSIGAGEIRALMGENGSGKSTLIRILAGYHEPDRNARVDLRGEPLTFPLKPEEPRRLGLCFVHQDLGLVTDGSVLENLFVGQFRTGRGWRVPWGAELRRASDALGRFGMSHIDPAQSVASLNAADRASLAIVRATYSLENQGGAAGSSRTGLLVLDETTSFLPDDGVSRVLNTVRRVAREGHAVLFVSHRLDEVFALCQSVTVLREGRVVLSSPLKSTSRHELVRAMTGADEGLVTSLDVGNASARPRPLAVDKALSVTDLVCGSAGPVSFDLFRGEVVGCTGLLGSGFESIPYGLFGAVPAEGEVCVAGHSVRLSKLRPMGAMRMGFGLVPADRMGQGGIGSASVTENVTMLRLNGGGRLSRVSGHAQLQYTEDAIRAFDIRPDRPDIDFRYLSGGNQQKAIIAKWSDWASSILLVHEPTRGVDIAAKRQILDAIQKLAVDGRAVLIASADCGDLAAICDRVLIISRGRITQSLTGDEITEQNIQASIHNG